MYICCTRGLNAGLIKADLHAVNACNCCSVILVFLSDGKLGFHSIQTMGEMDRFQLKIMPCFRCHSSSFLTIPFQLSYYEIFLTNIHYRLYYNI